MKPAFSDSSWYSLTTGTAVQLQVEGASRQAIEEGKEDELGGTLSLLPPLSLTLCETGLGASTGFGTNFCAKGRVDWDAGQPVPFTDAIFALSRWDAEEARDPDNFFYSDAGAKAGSRFAHLILKDKGVEWQLWMKNANEMMARCIATLPGRRNAAGAQGIRINCGGRLGGAEIARVEKYLEGSVPLHTLRANIDYGFAEAKTVYGKLGVKCWICKDEAKDKDARSAAPAPAPAPAAAAVAAPAN